MIGSAKDSAPCEDLEKLIGLVNDCVDRYAEVLSIADKFQHQMGHFA